MVLNEKFYNVSTFEYKKIQRVGLSIKSFTTRQILKNKLFVLSDFEIKMLQRVRF